MMLKLTEEEYRQERVRAISLEFAVTFVVIAVVEEFNIVFEVIVFLYFDLYLEVNVVPIFPDRPKKINS